MGPAVTLRAPLTAVLIAVAAAIAILNGVNALHKGGDFTDYIDAGLRLIDGDPLYAGSGVADGVIGPPFQAVLLAPFAWLARLRIEAGRLAWYLFNLACVAAAVYWWRRALPVARPLDAGLDTWGLVWPLVAVGYPLQTNFEHQNINAVLLALIGLCAFHESRGRSNAAGVWLGAAAAIKVFPLFLFGVLAARRAWRTLLWACASMFALTLVPILRYGPDRYLALLNDWWLLSGSGQWPIRRHNQSLFAMFGRYLEPTDLLTWGPIPDTASPVVHLLWLVVAVTVAVVFLVSVARMRSSSPAATAVALAAGLCLAVVLSPIAWEHYWLLLWPAFAFCYRPPADSPSWIRGAFWTAAVLTSGITRGTVGRTGVALARGLSVRTWAALLLTVASMRAYRALRNPDTHRL